MSSYREQATSIIIFHMDGIFAFAAVRCSAFFPTACIVCFWSGSSFKEIFLIGSSFNEIFSIGSSFKEIFLSGSSKALPIVFY
ncbi:13829_t:CDS:2 [Dentiscutata erythropus]|uniref:13829_t:CDS:1 n=1 Tax=Dentiscutata erythropus TaxID=1348616 RepID=A0A9N9D4Q3_9GLOM|nr:13829_t:CDS:2 [Dentiscutata erythropus]